MCLIILLKNCVITNLMRINFKVKILETLGMVTNSYIPDTQDPETGGPQT